MGQGIGRRKAALEIQDRTPQEVIDSKVTPHYGTYFFQQKGDCIISYLTVRLNT